MKSRKATQNRRSKKRAGDINRKSGNNEVSPAMEAKKSNKNDGEPKNAVADSAVAEHGDSQPALMARFARLELTNSSTFVLVIVCLMLLAIIGHGNWVVIGIIASAIIAAFLIKRSR